MTVACLAERRTLHIERCMGTVFTIDIRDPGPWGGAVARVVSWLHQVDAVFSTYRADSDISRIRRGELAVEHAHPDVAAVLDLAALIEEETGGYFTAWWDAALDPTGVVKGWAVEEASRLLLLHGSRNHAVNGGGDIQCSGGPAADEPWRIGITDPFDSSHLLSVVTGRDLAVATSGTAERGPHIVDPTTGEPARHLASVTVVGSSLTWVDAYATAAVAMGPDAARWIHHVPGHEALLVAADGEAVPTAGFPGMTLRPAGGR